MQERASITYPEAHHAAPSNLASITGTGKLELDPLAHHHDRQQDDKSLSGSLSQTETGLQQAEELHSFPTV
jgi:hypothetical protein